MTEDAGAAWAELRGGHEVVSLVALSEIAGQPLVSIRCHRDRTPTVAVWRTARGPLLVTGHRPPLPPGRQLPGVPGAGTVIWDGPATSGWDSEAVWAGARVWTPRLVLHGEDPTDAFPLLCSDCERRIPYTVEQVGADVTRALMGQPVDKAV